MARKSWKIWKENPVGCTGEGKKMKRKYKRRVKRRYNGNRLEIELGGEVTLAKLAFTEIRTVLECFDITGDT